MECRHPSGEIATFEVLRPLAEGGFGQVHLARSREGEDAWGYAVLKSRRFAGDAPEVSLLLEERFAAGFEHPNTITYLGSCPALKGRPGPILAFERAFPHPLLVLNKPGIRELLPHDPGTRYYPLPPDVALDLGMDLFSGLVHIHERGFVHHDVKLANLLLVSQDPVEGELLEDRELLDLVVRGRVRCVLADLGSCRSIEYLTELNRGEAPQTVQGLVPPQLTPIYAPPEAFLELDQGGEKRRQVLPSLDVYAAAIVLYVTLTGRTPYDHLDMDPSSFTELEDIKYSELRGAAVPFTRDAVDGIPLYDVDFLGSGRTFGEDLFGFLITCVDPAPKRRPTVQAARRRLAELFGFRDVDGRMRQGVFRSRRSASRLLETLRSSQGSTVAPEGGLEGALQHAERVLRREQRGISADEVGLALRHCRVAAEANVAFDPITFLLRRSTISVPVARRLRPKLLAGGLKLPPLAPLIASELAVEVLEVLRDHEELDAEAFEEACRLAQRLEKRRVPSTGIEVLVAQGALRPRVLDWALGLLTRRQREGEEQREAPRTNAFSVRGALQPEPARAEPPKAKPSRSGKQGTPSGRVITKRLDREAPRIARVSLPTVDVAASENFYQLLGLTLKAAAKDGSKVLLSDGGGFELELIRSPAPVSVAGLIVSFGAERVAAAVERLFLAGIEPLSAADDVITWIDPSGHQVMVRGG